MKVTTRLQTDGLVFICDYSPPRTADPIILSPIADLETDCISVACNPGQRVPAASAMWVAALKQHNGQGVVFNFSPRDMNKLALQSYLLGTPMLGGVHIYAAAQQVAPQR